MFSLYRLPGCGRPGCKTLLVLLALCCSGSIAQTSPIGTASGVVTGQTVNAVTGQPLARVLVRCGNAAVLTDYEGRFELPAAAGGPASLSAIKPGYAMSEGSAEAGEAALSVDAGAISVLVKMYPNATIVGSVLMEDGSPLADILIEPRRSLYDESGHRWVQPIVARTNSHGAFRLSLPAGDYSLHTGYLAPNGSRHEAILPATVPAETSTNGLATLHVRSGETLRLDFHPRTSPVATVSVRFEPESAPSNASVMVRSSDGEAFPLQQTMSDQAGEMKLVIPYGSYSLEARTQARDLLRSNDRGQHQVSDGMQAAATNVTLSKPAVTGVVLRFAPVNPIPVEMVIEPSATSDNGTPPTLNRLGLSLEDVSPGGSNSGSAGDRLISRGDQALFNPAPGSYRLRAQGNGEWFVRSATYGTTDLLQQNLTVAQGTGMLPIRLIVSNRVASLAGVVRLKGLGVAARIYLVASTPSAKPVLVVPSGVDGSYRHAAIPAGSYRVIAFEHPRSINFEDPETMAALSNEMQSISLSGGDQGSLDLTVAPAAEVR